jgi:hypothetical protein
MDHLKKGLERSIRYALDRFSEGGDLYQQVLVYPAARLFNPENKNTQTGKGLCSYREFASISPLNKDSIFESLIASWHIYKARARLVIMGKEVAMKILHWHYNCWLENHKYVTETLQHEGCPYCQHAECNSCSCSKDMMCWWETALILALIIPSRAPAERVFSILNRMWTDLQTHALSNIIRTSMFLACNKRSL